MHNNHSAKAFERDTKQAHVGAIAETSEGKRLAANTQRTRKGNHSPRRLQNEEISTVVEGNIEPCRGFIR